MRHPNIIILILSLFAVLVLMNSCSTSSPPQVQEFQTIGQIDAEATATIDAMDMAAIKGLISTNNIPKASQMYNDLHKALLVASITAQNGTNALAPLNLAKEGVALDDFVSTIMTKH